MRLNQILNLTLKSLIMVLVAMGSPWLLQKVWKTLDFVVLQEPCMFMYLWFPSTLISVGYFKLCYVSYVWLCVIPWIAACQASLSFTISWNLLKLTSTELVMSSSHLILCHPLLLLPSVFSSELTLLIRWPKYWSFSFSMSPFNAYSGLISLRIDWLGLLAVQGTLKSLLQYYSSLANIM